ncbi:MAG: AAA family ATPase, partial [Candidatus Nanohaloarchaea archaeon]
MPEENNDDNGENGPINLKAGEIPPNAQEDIGSGIVRIDSNVMEKLEIREGDAVVIRGDRETVARAARSYPADVGLGIVRMDGYIRKNAGTSLRETVEVEKAELEEAEKVVLAPAEEGVTIQVSNPSIFKRTLVNRAVTDGDLIVPSSCRERRR